MSTFTIIFAGSKNNTSTKASKYAMPSNVIDYDRFADGVQWYCFNHELNRLFKAYKSACKQVESYAKRAYNEKAENGFSNKYYTLLEKLRQAKADREAWEVCIQSYCTNEDAHGKKPYVDNNVDLFSATVAACISPKVEFKGQTCHALYVKAVAGMNALEAGKMPKKAEREDFQNTLNQFLRTSGDDCGLYKSRYVRLSQSRYINILATLRKDLKYTEKGIETKWDEIQKISDYDRRLKGENAYKEKQQNALCKQAFLAALESVFDFNVVEEGNVTINIKGGTFEA